MKIETNLCMGCMEELDENGACKHCGKFDNDSYISSYLAPKTYLSNRYIVGKLIGYCGESALYIGFDTEEQRKVTIREYMPDTLCTREKDCEQISVNPERLPLYKTYLAEFAELHTTLMRSTNIPCVQTVLDVFSENNTAYAVMDYIGGISLKAYLAGCGEVISWEQAKELFPPILTALNMLHSLGIIHRGISTSTLFVSEKNELKLIGFSISAAHTADSDIGYEVFGGYAPPEQYSSARRNGSWTDVYGISAVLYRCLTGITPPTAPERLVEDTLVEPMLINRNIPKNVSDVIMKGMELEAENRISTVNEFVDRLFEQPSPASDSSGEIDIPIIKPSAKKAASNSSNSGGSKGTNSHHSSKSASAKEKERIRRDKIKFIVVSSFLGVILLGFLFAMIQATSPSSQVKESTAAPQSTYATVIGSIGSSAATTIPHSPPTNTARGESYILPDFVGTLYATVSNSSQYSYIVFNPTYDYNDEFKAGQIISQSIEKSTRVSTGVELSVTVSKGPEKAPLPDYIGVKAEDYVKILSEMGIKYRIEEEETAEFEEGYVARCNKEIGEDVSLADSEEVIVYSAIKPKETQPPATQPPATEPPVTEPVSTAPAATENPVSAA